MARPRKPTANLELVGAFDRNPQRKRKSEPEPTGKIGKAPSSLNAMEKKIWKEFTTNSPHGVFGNSDRIALEVACKLLSEFRIDYENFTAAKMNQLTNLLGRFGMTPSDRSKVIVQKDEVEDDPWSQL